MKQSLPQGNHLGQSKNFPLGKYQGNPLADMLFAMAKKKRLTRQDQIGSGSRRLHLREWMLYEGRRRGREVKQAEIAKAAGVNPPHVSNVLSGKKGGPGRGHGFETDGLIGISEFFGCSVNDLFRPPPDVMPTGAKLDLDQPLTVRHLLSLQSALKGKLDSE